MKNTRDEIEFVVMKACTHTRWHNEKGCEQKEKRVIMVINVKNITEKRNCTAHIYLCMCMRLAEVRMTNSVFRVPMCGCGYGLTSHFIFIFFIFFFICCLRPEICH